MKCEFCNREVRGGNLWHSVCTNKHQQRVDDHKCVRCGDADPGEYIVCRACVDGPYLGYGGA